jgi:hypothetical protein
MGIGIGILLIAIGAILKFAVSATVSGVNVQTVGVILMVVGAVGLLIDLVIFMPRRRAYSHQQVTSYETPAAPVQAAPVQTVTRDSVDGTI